MNKDEKKWSWCDVAAEIVLVALAVATIVALGKLVKVERENDELERKVQQVHDERVALERANGYVYEREAF